MDLQLLGAPYNDPVLEPATRVEDLLARMSLPEKLAQLVGVWGRGLVAGGVVSEEAAARLVPHGVGHVSRNSLQKGPRETAQDANALQAWLRENTRLGVPAIIHEEACAGLMARGACAFPMPIGLASTFDPALVECVGKVIQQQMQSVGAHQALAPVLDVARDHRWGRIEETFGEDTFLTSRMGVAFVRGVQGNDADSGIACTGKHFVGYSASESGLNWAPAVIGARELRDEHLPAFAAAIGEAGLLSVMNAYQEIDGVPVAASRELLTDVLRGELRFSGPVVSDYEAVVSLQNYHEVAADKVEAAAQALTAGIDLELPVADCYADPLDAALRQGLVTQSQVDDAVRRVLMLKFVLGIFERRSVDVEESEGAFSDGMHRTLALEAARRSLVLLRNESALLPMESARRIAVIGPSAKSLRNLQGTYQYPTFYEFQFGPLDGRASITVGSAGANNVAAAGNLDATTRAGIVEALRCQFPGAQTVLQAILEIAPEGSVVSHQPGCEIDSEDTSLFGAALELAARSDTVIAVMGGRSGLARDCTEGEFNDRATLDLPGVQQALLEQLVATGTPVVLVLVNGRPPCLNWAASHVPAILEAWLPGEKGPTAIAEVLFGRIEPTGRLPVSLSRSVGQMPLRYNHKPSARRSFPYGRYTDLPADALYPFGHGLSYTEFESGPLELEQTAWTIGQAMHVRAEIRNVGARAGTAIPQLYLRRLSGSLTSPVAELKAFCRVELQPGESRYVDFLLDSSSLAYCGLDGRFVVTPGRARIQLGASSRDIWQQRELEVVGLAQSVEWTDLRPAEVCLIDAKVTA